MPLVYVKPKRYSGRGAYHRYTGKGAYRRVRGKGAYTVDNGPWANVGASVGKSMANMAGMPPQIGEYLGRRALHYAARVFGSGAYRTTYRGKGAYRRTIRGKGAYDVDSAHMSPELPRFEKGKDDSVLITFKEYLGDVISSSNANTFKIEKFPINPAMLQTFPWLSELCSVTYQQYRFEGLIFQYKTFSADALNSTNTALGSVFACINYDANDPDPTSRSLVENMDWSQSVKPSENMLIPVECAPRQTGMNGLLYVLNQPVVPTRADPKTYLLGNFYIGTTGCQGTSVNLGSLYVTYKVRLYKPCILPPLSNANRVMLVRTGATSAAPLGTATDSANSSTALCDTLGVTFTSGTVLTISNQRLQVGARYVLMFLWTSDQGASTPATRTYSSGFSALPVFPINTTISTAVTSSQTYNPLPAGASVASSSTIDFMQIINDNVDQTITLSAATLPANAYLNLYIWQVCGAPSSTLGVYSP